MPPTDTSLERDLEAAPFLKLRRPEPEPQAEPAEAEDPFDLFGVLNADPADLGPIEPEVPRPAMIVEAQVTEPAAPETPAPPPEPVLRAQTTVEIVAKKGGRFRFRR